MKSKIGTNFGSGIALILVSVAIFMFAFISEDSITGLVVTEPKAEQSLIEFANFDELSTLAAGNYYVDSDGIVYWLDDESKPAIAKASYVDESQKNRHIYIDNQGRIGYVLGTFP